MKPKPTQRMKQIRSVTPMMRLQASPKEAAA